MKKLLYVFMAIGMAIGAQAQRDPAALTVLDAMSAKYKQIGSFEAKFTQQMINESANIDETIKGEIAVKGDMYVLNVAGQEIFNNGVDVYSYSEELREVTVSTYQPEESDITLGNIYDLYKDGFKYNLIETSSNGDRTIELDPESKEKTYYKIKLVIDKNDDLKEFTVFERSGNKYVYKIKGFKEADLSDAYFTFSPDDYPDVEVIDFR